MDQFQGILTRKASKALQATDRIVLAAANTPPRWFGAIFLAIGLLAVGVGIAGTMGLIKGEGSMWVFSLVGGIFALAGYCMVTYVSQVEFDPIRRQWRKQNGVWPFVQRAQGNMDEWSHVTFDRAQRSTTNEGVKTTYAVWAIGLVARDNRLPPLTIPGLEFPSVAVERAEALALARELAQKLQLPLREEAGEAMPPPVTPAPFRPQIDSSAPITPPPSQRIAFERDPKGSASIVMRGNPWKALPGLIPLVFFGVFIWQAERMHQDFLNRVSADSRAFFERGPSMLLFFSPLLVFAGLIFVGVLAFSLVKQHIQVTAEAVVYFHSLFGREFGRSTVPRNTIRGIEFAQRGEASGQVKVSGFQVVPRTRTVQYLVIVSDQTDLHIGSDLNPQERDWLQKTLLTLLGSPTPVAAS